jgi:hypothetical protein
VLCVLKLLFLAGGQWNDILSIMIYYEIVIVSINFILVRQDENRDIEEITAGMNSVNPKFVLRYWHL